MIETQSSQLLPALFEHVDEDRRLTVLHLGPALPILRAPLCVLWCRMGPLLGQACRPMM